MIRVLQSQADPVYDTIEEAEAAHGRLKLVFTVTSDPILDVGEYYLPIPETCPYSERPCTGGGCTPCEFVP